MTYFIIYILYIFKYIFRGYLIYNCAHTDRDDKKQKQEEKETDSVRLRGEESIYRWWLK